MEIDRKYSNSISRRSVRTMKEVWMTDIVNAYREAKENGYV